MLMIYMSIQSSLRSSLCLLIQVAPSALTVFYTTVNIKYLKVLEAPAGCITYFFNFPRVLQDVRVYQDSCSATHPLATGYVQRSSLQVECAHHFAPLECFAFAAAGKRIALSVLCGVLSFNDLSAPLPNSFADDPPVAECLFFMGCIRFLLWSLACLYNVLIC